MFIRFFLFFVFCISSYSAYATQCSDIFPGPQTFTSGNVDSIESGVTCNGTGCSIQPFTAVDSFPSISASNDFNSTSISDGIYEHKGWGLGDNATVNFSGSGTAVIYFKDSDVVIKKGTKINLSGNASNVFLIFKGKLKIEEDAKINAFIYVKGSETTFEEDVEINGGVAARTKLSLKKNGTYNFTSSDINNLDSQGFCTNSTPLNIHHYEIVHDGVGSTCAAETVTLKACLDASCSTLASSPVTVDLMANGGLKTTETFTGSTSIAMSHGSAGNVTLSLANESISPSSNLECDLAGANNCVISFSSATCPALTSCEDIFSNTKSFNTNGGYSIDSDNECNGGSCTPVPGFTPVTPFPTIPFGGAFNSTTITDGPSYYTSWGLSKESEVEFSGSGTAVLYFSGSVSIPKETLINEDGDPSNVMIIVNGSLSIAKESEINAFIYVTGSLTIAKEVEFEGAIAANGSLSVAKEGEFDFDSNDLNDLDSHGFCNAGGAAINHYQIIHDGNGLTCEAETITVRACTNVFDGTCTLSTDPVTLDLVATGSTTVSNSLSFTGSTSALVSYTTPETVALSISNTSISASDGYVCNSGNAGDCNLTFADAGFRFLYNGTTTISNQIAGDIFPNTLAIQAVENQNGVCTGIFSGNVDVSLSQENVSPSGSGGLSFQQAGNNIAKYPSFTNNVTLNFGSNSTATLSAPRYLDAGQIRLRASYNDAGISLNGTSNAFWVKPDKLVLEAKSGATVLSGNTASSPVSHKAGQSFDFVVTAVNSLGNTTQNYSPSSLQMTHSRLLPNDTGAVSGDFTYASGASIPSGSTTTVSLTPFSGGISSFSNANYDEVGVINIDIQDGNYGGVGLVVPADDITIGRFKPDHFVQTIESVGAFATTCTAVSSDFAYTGQISGGKGTIGYGFALEPQIKIVAQNANGDVTRNFHQDSEGSSNDFMTLVSSDINLSPPTADSSQVGLDTNPIGISAILEEGTITQSANRGEVIYTLSSDDRFYYVRNANAKIAPFPSDINIVVASIVSDGVSATTLTDIDGTSPVSIRYGRLLIENGFGPETESLRVSMQTQYFDGTNFVLNTDDNCTSMPAYTKITSGNLYDSLAANQYRLLDTADGEPIIPADTSINGSGTVTNGIFTGYEFTAPGANKRGALLMEYEAPAWLKYDWSTTDNNPSATFTFGTISWQ